MFSYTSSMRHISLLEYWWPLMATTDRILCRETPNNPNSSTTAWKMRELNQNIICNSNSHYWSFSETILFFFFRHFYNLHTSTLTATIICLLQTKNCWWWKITGSIFGAHALLGAVTREYLNSQEIFGSTALAVVQLWQYLQYLLYRKIFGSFAAA